MVYSMSECRGFIVNLYSSRTPRFSALVSRRQIFGVKNPGENAGWKHHFQTLILFSA